MMKNILVIVLTFCAIQMVQAQAQSAISFENEIFDFGEIPEGPKVETEFEFTNTGTEPLIISKAKGSCGCTVPEWPKEPILPGEKGMIKVVYNTSKRPGSFSKSVTLTSNAATPTKVLKIRGKVYAAAEEEETLPVKEPLLMAPSH